MNGFLPRLLKLNIYVIWQVSEPSKFFLDDCKPLGEDPTRFPIQMYCGDGQYSAIGAIWFVKQ